MLKLEAISLNKIGGVCALADHQWASLELILRDTENDHGRPVDIGVLVPKRPEATLRELEEAARSEAIAILEAALGLLKESTVAELAARQTD